MSPATVADAISAAQAEVTSWRAMADKGVQQGIPKAKVLETVHIARFAMATKMIGDAEPVFDALVGAQK